MKYSFIIPVYNRPDEVDELLASLQSLREADMEVLVVEDGSSVPCEEVVRRYEGLVPNLRYFSKPNSGPGQSRNFGAERAVGDYLIVLDSDVVVPEGYLQAVSRELDTEPADAFGGPDRAHESFSPVQKAINYSMTSFFTTGGIRGGKKKMDRFYPRSFNMGIRRDVYAALGGFSKMRFGEDIDFSIRIIQGGYACRLFPEAWVWHKRRTDLRKFFRQVFNSGIARINLYKKYPQSLKLVHLLPFLFTCGVILLLVVACWLLAVEILHSPLLNNHSPLPTPLLPLFPLALFSLLIFVDSSIQNRSLRVGFLSIAAAFTQLLGYGLGFAQALWRRVILGKSEYEAFKNSFYK